MSCIYFPEYLETFQSILSSGKLSRASWVAGDLSEKLFRASRNFQSIQKKFRMSGNLSECSEIFRKCLETLKSVQNLPMHLKTFKSIWKHSRVLGNFWECSESFSGYLETFQCLETFQSIQKLSRVSRDFWECPESLSWKISEHLKTIQSILKLSRVFENFPEFLNNFQSFLWMSVFLPKNFITFFLPLVTCFTLPCKNFLDYKIFPDINARLLPRFLTLSTRWLEHFEYQGFSKKCLKIWWSLCNF